nr:gamma-aminobutyric acid type B receptor subunit 2-like [Ciona intestinalis]|eukprot:XP_002122633.3 gamma-aminobutyric acid type B receptor subunit 2-like [Ciona intestinalis]
MSSPNLNNVIATGCVIAYISLILMAIESKQVSPYIFDVLCKVRQFLPPCAFTLAFGTMFLKTWRVHAIFTNVTVKKQVIKDYKLFGILSIFLFVDVIILITWFAVDPMRRVVKNSTNEIWKEGGQYVIIPQNEFCTSDYTFIWMAIVCSYKGILLVFGLFLAWNTRHVALPTLNDSKYIGVSVYITVITCVIGPTTSFALKDYHDISYAITSVSILLCTTATLCLVFVPKVTALRRLGDRPDNSMQIRLHGLKSKERQPLRSLVSMTVSPFSGNMSGYPARSGTGESTIEDKQSSSTSEQNGLLANEDIVKKLKIEKTKLEKDFKKACELHERLEKTTLSPDSCYIQIMKESKPTHQSLSGI